MSETTTTDPTPETAKDRQLIYWQQQCFGQEHDIKRLTDALEQKDKRIAELEGVIRSVDGLLDCSIDEGECPCCILASALKT